MKIVTVGLDIAKQTFQAHGVDCKGKVVLGGGPAFDPCRYQRSGCPILSRFCERVGAMLPVIGTNKRGNQNRPCRQHRVPPLQRAQGWGTLSVVVFREKAGPPRHSDE